MDTYLAKIEAFIEQFDQETLDAFTRISTTKQFKKGDFLLQQGDVCKKSYWIESGIVRKYYIHNGKECITELLFEQDIAVSLDSYCLQKKSREFIQAVTDVSISQTDYSAFQAAKKHFPKLIELDLMMIEYYAMWLEERLFQFQTMDATKRYLQLIKQQPHFIQHIPLTYIASYLGISLETLSRIRGKIQFH